MLKSPSLSRSQASPTLYHYAPTSTRPSLSRRTSAANKPSPSPQPQQQPISQSQPKKWIYVDAFTQWSPIMPSRMADGVSPPVQVKTEDVPPEPIIAPEQPNVEALQDMKPPIQLESPSMKRRQSSVDSAHTVSKKVSSPKRVKPQTPVTILPVKYELCEVEDMVVLIASMIAELIQRNDVLPLQSGILTRFHSRSPPGISVLDYLQRLAKHATLTPPLLLSMVYYIDQLCASYPAFTVTTLTVHRFLITAATVASKGLSDSFWNNSTYARVGGVKVAELGLLELEFLHRVDWKIVPNPEMLIDYYKGLIQRNDLYKMEGDFTDESDELDDDDEESDEPDTPEQTEVGTDADMKDTNEPNVPNQKTESGHEETSYLPQTSSSNLEAKLLSTHPTITMKLTTLLLALSAHVFCITATVTEQIDTATIYIQPLTSSSAYPLASISYNPSTLSASLLSYEPPTDLLPSPQDPSSSPNDNLALTGIFDEKTSTFKSSTSLLSLTNFEKGYRPTILLTIDAQGAVLGVTIKSGVIDAGATRDFAPKVEVRRVVKGGAPVLGPNVVLSKEGKTEGEVVEKSFLQKYWWVLLGAAMLTMTAGGGSE
ncbi:hypothetical protein SBOR_4563 [Sclerotinia borealis F-4128]|uniref:Nuc-1 negative regulatory protein preg n=1 Tax=Sclerotinia borealis (strain F-4128) TaxID=1432307 RepID=W9CKG7_SCLBF|nr:hypothetical protein SBOR_4563 [Sclerotinia borealis F-4128]